MALTPNVMRHAFFCVCVSKHNARYTNMALILDVMRRTFLCLGDGHMLSCRSILLFVL